MTSGAARKFRAVLFDLDGTLLDTAPDMATALNALRREHGAEPLPFATIRPFVSHGALSLVRLGFPGATNEEFEALRTRFLEIYGGCVAVETRAFGGLLAALDRLEAAGIPWGIVTNKPAIFAEPLLQALGLRQRAGVLVCGDSLAERKPHPAPLLHAARSLGVAPVECVYIGDAEIDVLAAQAAGMEVFVAMFGYLRSEDTPLEWPAQGWLESPEALATLLLSIECAPESHTE